jgi:anti-sigma regulatory factor (Ser/Thr protein kinase)
LTSVPNLRPLHLRLFAEPSHLAIARAFISSSLRVLDQPEDSINDLRLAVSELLAVLAIRNQGPVDITLSFEDQYLVTRISGPPNLPEVPTEIADLVTKLTADGIDMPGDSWIITTLLL